MLFTLMQSLTFNFNKAFKVLCVMLYLVFTYIGTICIFDKDICSFGSRLKIKT